MIFDAKMPMTRLFMFTRQLKSCLGSGLTADRTLRILSEDKDLGSLRQKLSTAANRVAAGKSFYHSLDEAARDELGEYFLALIYVAEETGAWDSILTQLSSLFENLHQVDARLRGQFLFPKLALSGLLIALFVFQFFAFVVLLIPVCLFFFGKTLIPPGKMTQIRWRLRLGNPLTGGLWRSLLVTLFLDTWSILQRVGFPLYSSHDLLLQLFPYHFMKKNIDRFFHRIQNGESPDVAIVELQFLDSATRAAMEIGRMSGTGDQLIKTVSELSMMELSTKTAAILSVTSSLFITVGSLLVGLTILLSAWSVFS